MEASASVWECFLFFILLGTSVSHFTVGVAKLAPSGSPAGPWQGLAEEMHVGCVQTALYPWRKGAVA